MITTSHCLAMWNEVIPGEGMKGPTTQNVSKGLKVFFLNQRWNKFTTSY